MISKNNVTVNSPLATPQFRLLWLVLALNVAAGIGVLESVPPMLQNLFSRKVTVLAAGGFVGLLSLFNMGGRFVWGPPPASSGRSHQRRPRQAQAPLSIALAWLVVFTPLRGASVSSPCAPRISPNKRESSRIRAPITILNSCCDPPCSDPLPRVPFRDGGPPALQGPPLHKIDSREISPTSSHTPVNTLSPNDLASLSFHLQALAPQEGSPRFVRDTRPRTILVTIGFIH